MTITQRRQLQRATAIRALESAHVRQSREERQSMRLVVSAYLCAFVFALVVGIYFATGG